MKKLVSLLLLCAMLVTLAPQGILAYSADDDGESVFGDIQVTSNHNNYGYTFTESDYVFWSGESFDLKGTVFTGSYDSPINIPSASYSWELVEDDADIDYGKYVTITPDSKDSSKCHVKIADDAPQNTYYIWMDATYTDSNGELHKEEYIDEVGFDVYSEYYYIDLQQPDNFAKDESIVIRPSVKKISEKGIETVTVDSNKIKFNEETSNLDKVTIKRNTDGSITITRLSNDSFNLYLTSDYTADFEDKQIHFDEWKDNVYFPSGTVYYDGQKQLEISLNTKELYSKNVTYQLYVENEGEKILIPASAYQEKRTDQSMYFTFTNEWAHNNLPNDTSHNIDVSVLRNNKEISNASIWIRSKYQTFSFDVLKTKIRQDETYSISKSGNGYVGPDVKACAYVIENVESSDTSILKISNADSCWNYVGLKPGNVAVTVTLQYYDNRKPVQKKMVYNVSILDANYEIEVDNNGLNKVYIGGVNYCNLSTFATPYNGTKKEYMDVIYEAEVLHLYNNPNEKYTQGVAEIVDGNKLKFTVSERGSWQWYMDIKITAKRKDGTILAERLYQADVTDEQQYIGRYEYMGNDDNYIQIMPKLRFYSNEFPNGKDVTSEYNLKYSWRNNTILSAAQNNDGSITFKRDHNRIYYRDFIDFEWYTKDTGKKVSSGTFTVYETIEESDRPVTPSKPEVPKPEKEVSKAANITISDDETLKFNIYWNLKNVDDPIVKMYFEDQPDKIWYTGVKHTYASENLSWDYVSSVSINSGEMTRIMNIQLISSDDGEVVEEFSTSAECYAQKLLQSTDESTQKYKPLMKAIFDYGAASQQYFKMNTSELANKSLSTADKAISAIPQNEINKYNVKSWFDIDGMEYVGSSLIVGDKIKLRHYFSLDAKKRPIDYSYDVITFTSQNTYTGTGYVYKLTKSGDKYYVEIPLDTKNFFMDKTLIVSDGKSNIGLNYYVMNYIAKAYVSSSSSIELKNLIATLYWMQIQKTQLKNVNS